MYSGARDAYAARREALLKAQEERETRIKESVNWIDHSLAGLSIILVASLVTVATVWPEYVFVVVFWICASIVGLLVLAIVVGGVYLGYTGLTRFITTVRNKL
jgi:hypothetical protein